MWPRRLHSLNPRSIGWSTTSAQRGGQRHDMWALRGQRHDSRARTPVFRTEVGARSAQERIPWQGSGRRSLVKAGSPRACPQGVLSRGAARWASDAPCPTISATPPTSTVASFMPLDRLKRALEGAAATAACLCRQVLKQCTSAATKCRYACHVQISHQRYGALVMGSRVLRHRGVRGSSRGHRPW